LTSPTSRKATLIILAWNRWPLTKRCLVTLHETDLTNTEVLVVDNGSADETPARLAELPWVRTLRLPANVGFVRGNNAGIAAADPESDIVLLNNDLEFTQADWLERLRACAASDDRIGVVGCRLRMLDGRLLHAGTFILPDTLWGQQVGAGEKDVGQYSTQREVEGIVFACAYLRRELVTAIGGLSLDFQSYFEDTDYCLRAREAGFRTVLCGDVTLVHDEHGSTRGDQQGFNSIFQTSRKTFEKKWSHRLSARYERSVLWQSIMNFPTGYAMSCRQILRTLDELGVRATYRYLYGPGTVFPPVEARNSGDYYLNVLTERRFSGRPRVGVVYGQGDEFHRNRGRYKIGFTMLEVNGFPKEWVAQANRMDEIWVPTHFNRDGFLRCGLKRPIHIMPLGVDSNYFNPRIASERNPSGEFVFLSLFEWGERKAPEMLLRCFNEVFRADEPVRLVCKIINRDPTLRLAEAIRSLRLQPKGGKISYLFNVEFPHYQLGSLYCSADAFLSISRGEGWNMPLMEAMACGLPAIATDWGAHREWVTEENAYPLRVAGEVQARAKCPYYNGFEWAEPDGDHFRHLLREVYENRDEARRRGLAAAQMIADGWTWKHTASRIKARIEEVSA
jgi:GT2 family glycosyltransferase